MYNLINAACVAVIYPIMFIIRLIVTLMGLLIVPIALPFAKVNDSQFDADKKWADWKLVRLPIWAWPWDNLRDGAMGDPNGTYRFRQAPSWAINDFLRAFNWLALRNPCNNFSRFTPLLNVNMVGKTVKILKQTDKVWFFKVSKYPYWHVRYFAPFGVIKLGHKIELKHNGYDWSKDPQRAIKGFTFRIDFND